MGVCVCLRAQCGPCWGLSLAAGAEHPALQAVNMDHVWLEAAAGQGVAAGLPAAALGA